MTVTRVDLKRDGIRDVFQQPHVGFVHESSTEHQSTHGVVVSCTMVMWRQWHLGTD